MGEANSRAIELISRITGHAPQYEMTEDGIQTLRIGDIVLVATHFALWSDPDIFIDKDNAYISWGGASITIPVQPGVNRH